MKIQTCQKNVQNVQQWLNSLERQKKGIFIKLIRALEIKDFDKNPKLLCIYAELMKDITYFKKAW